MDEDDKAVFQQLVEALIHLGVASNGTEMWTLYDKPKDFPKSLVARQWFIETNGPVAGRCIVAQPERIGLLRDVFARMGFVRMERSEDDDLKILETWI